MTPREVPLKAAREQLGTLVDEVATRGDLVYITRRGHRMAALVPVWAMADLLEIAAAHYDIADGNTGQVTGL